MDTPPRILLHDYGVNFIVQNITADCIDLERGYFYKGWLKKNVSLRMQRIECCELDDIHAPQIIAEYVLEMPIARFSSYELNIVKKDATRIIVDHGDLSVLRREHKYYRNISVFQCGTRLVNDSCYNGTKKPVSCAG